MNRLDIATQAKVIGCLVEGCSVRATVRMTGVALNTITKLLADIGRACDDYFDANVRNLKVRRLQCDEICASSEPRPKIPASKRRLNLDGATFGLGSVLMPIRSSLFPTW
jgi:hypothetical protein